MLKFLNNFKLSKKMIFFISVFLIAFFSINFNVNAANFKYKDFDFDKFAEYNKNYWSTYCNDSDNSENCQEKFLSSQKEFYTRLYKILAKYEEKGVNFNSNTDLIIIATVFFNLSLDMFNDDGQQYKNFYDSIKSSYNYDLNENIDLYNPDNDDPNNVAIAEYFAKETDTLKLLIKSMIGYKTTCIGYKEGTYEIRNVETTDENGNKVTKNEQFLVCDIGQPTSGLLDHEVCASTVSTELIGFWDKFVSVLGKFFGIKNSKQVDCNNDAVAAGFNSNAIYKVDQTQSVDEKYYWQFLIDGNYFDKKHHLEGYYSEILNSSGYKSMDEFNAAIENDSSLAEKYEASLKEVRTYIVDLIIKILHDYNGYEINSGTSASYNETGKTSYWWPIGSVETTVEDGKTFATGEPESSSIYRNYGTSRDDVLNEYNKNYGIEIIANETLGASNIIAVSGGTVLEVYNECKSNDDKECGSGYGNYVIIIHSDGNSTLYGHLHEGTITVNVGNSVSQGEVIGKMGASGKISRTSLYFEVRTGSSKATAADPNNYVSLNNPRPATASGDFLKFLLGLEGTGNIIGDSYQVYCNSGDIPTVGIGVTLSNHYEKFASVGYPLTPPYSNYCGKTIPIEIVDKVQNMVLDEYMNNVKTTVANAGLNLKQNQLEALLSLKYNCGNIVGFVEAYNYYGSTDTLCNNWWINKASGGPYSSTLIIRRKKECQLFVHGIYDGTYS